MIIDGFQRECIEQAQLNRIDMVKDTVTGTATAKITNEYVDRIKTACTESEQRDIAVALLAHVAYLLGRESLRQKGEQE